MNIVDICRYMAEKDASDVYITVGVPPMFRINGETNPGDIWKVPLTPEDTKDLTLSTMRPDQKEEFLQTNECNLALAYDGLGPFRVNAYVQQGAPGMVIRQIKAEIMTLAQLKLPAILGNIIMSKRGLILVVGGTGSGKSTSLAAMINHRNENSTGHIITIEDPIEYVHPHKRCVIMQREVGTDTLSFKAALKNTLRQAPDVILLGEIRDTETMEHAVEFAETGHLCLGTLHANNANQAIERVMNFFPAERHAQFYMQLSLNMRAIVSQRLVKCENGGRAAAVEILLDTPRIKELILKGDIDSIKEAMNAGQSEGTQTFDNALYNLYKEGRISMKDALVNADSPNDLRLKFKMDAVSSGAAKDEDVSIMSDGTKLEL